MVVIDTETKMIMLESLYASSHIDKIIEVYVTGTSKRDHFVYLLKSRYRRLSSD